MPSTLELARLRGLGQDAPLLDPYGQPLDYEGPSDYVDPAEQRMLFPQGLQDPGHQGGLEQTAVASRIRDTLSGPPPDSGTVPQPAAQQAALPSHAGTAESAATAPSQMHSVWSMTDPAAMAKADRAQRQSGALGSLGHSVGTLIRLAAMAYAGGGAGGIGGAGGAGAASGTGAGASSAAGFGANYWAGLGQGAGTGAGGYLGRLSSGLLSGQTGGIGGAGMLSRLGGSGSGGGGGDAISNALTGIFDQRRRAALEAAGLGPYAGGLVSDAAGPVWAG